MTPPDRQFKFLETNLPERGLEEDLDLRVTFYETREKRERREEERVDFEMSERPPRRTWYIFYVSPAGCV